MRRGGFDRSCWVKRGARCSNDTVSFRLERDVDWTALGVSLRLSLATMATLVAIGVPIAYWTAFSRWRWKFLIEAVVALPLVLPPTVLGFYVLMAIGPHSPLGRGWQAAVGRGLPFTFEGLLIASV